MKAVFVQIVLIAVLVACAMSLGKQLEATRSRIAIERSRAVIGERVTLTSIAGIDVHGIITETLPKGAHRIVVAGFRGSTVEQDMSLWTAVAALLADAPDIYIVAYCDDARCADAARKLPYSPRFKVIRYGEVSNTQALLSVDGRGECLLVGPKMSTLRRIAWRTPPKVAEDIAREVRQ